jgi:hypothetical protein
MITEIIEAVPKDEDSPREVSGPVESPSQQKKVFATLMEALCFAMWARPRSLAINTEGDQVVMDYLGSEGHL